MATIRCDIPNHRILAGMVLLSTHGGVLVQGDARPSAALMGCTRVDTELGTLYLNSENTSLAEFDVNDYDTDPREPLKEG